MSGLMSSGLSHKDLSDGVSVKHNYIYMTVQVLIINVTCNVDTNVNFL